MSKHSNSRNHHAKSTSNPRTRTAPEVYLRGVKFNFQSHALKLAELELDVLEGVNRRELT